MDSPSYKKLDVVEWLPRPFEADSVLPQDSDGLEYLVNLEELWLCRVYDNTGDLRRRAAKDCFRVETEFGFRVFNVKIERKGVSCLNANRQQDFILHLMNRHDCCVLKIHRPYRTSAALFSWLNVEGAGWRVSVYGLHNRLLGYIKQTSSPFHKSFDVYDDSGTVILQVWGPLIEIDLLKKMTGKKRVNYKVLNPTHKIVHGSIQRRYKRFWKSLLAQDCRVRIVFDRNMKNSWKCLLMAVAFLIESLRTDYDVDY